MSGNCENQSIVPFPSESGLPDPLEAPGMAAASVMRGWREVGGQSPAQLVEAVRQAPGMEYVDEELVGLWERGVVLPTLDAALVVLSVVGRAALVILAGLPLRA